ncbi:unnamed protein product [Rangifer tarandus platyrhynchus]|uniref:Basic proline-rich protein-like n=1 Tax=Rangifer tarandus platyrhynchus TaxID=3082113 RepID=A0ABN8ZBP3_RANTA|nr:unnamed protein product [Rangifer tarandus platyrhynchus]
MSPEPCQAFSVPVKEPLPSTGSAFPAPDNERIGCACLSTGSPKEPRSKERSVRGDFAEGCRFPSPRPARRPPGALIARALGGAHRPLPKRLRRDLSSGPQASLPALAVARLPGPSPWPPVSAGPAAGIRKPGRTALWRRAALRLSASPTSSLGGGTRPGATQEALPADRVLGAPPPSAGLAQPPPPSPPLGTPLGLEDSGVHVLLHSLHPRDPSPEDCLPEGDCGQGSLSPARVGGQGERPPKSAVEIALDKTTPVKCTPPFRGPGLQPAFLKAAREKAAAAGRDPCCGAGLTGCVSVTPLASACAGALLPGAFPSPLRAGALAPGCRPAEAFGASGPLALSSGSGLVWLSGPARCAGQQAAGDTGLARGVTGLAGSLWTGREEPGAYLSVHPA